MTIAEKYFRLFYKVKDDVKLTNEQWKVVRMMHECLRENNKPKLPHGKILVDKKHLVDHLECIRKCLKETDALMLNPQYREFSNGTRGEKMAKIWNELNFTMQSISFFQLKTPLERLHNYEEKLK